MDDGCEIEGTGIDLGVGNNNSRKMTFVDGWVVVGDGRFKCGWKGYWGWNIRKLDRQS